MKVLHLYIAWEPRQRSWYSGQAMGWITVDSWFVLPAKIRHVLFSKASRSAPEPTQPPIKPWSKAGRS